MDTGSSRGTAWSFRAAAKSALETEAPGRGLRAWLGRQEERVIRHALARRGAKAIACPARPVASFFPYERILSCTSDTSCSATSRQACVPHLAKLLLCVHCFSIG
jgi:hypothetical protein